MTLTQRKTIQSVITYFENNHHRMHYWKFYLKNYPIGSGVTEAACKTVVKQRASQAGMRWLPETLGNVLKLRAIVFSDNRWNQFWEFYAKAAHHSTFLKIECKSHNFEVTKPKINDQYTHIQR